MIKTNIDLNEHGVYVLKIYIDGELIRECYNDKDEMQLSEIADVAEELYKIGYSDGKYGV